MNESASVVPGPKSNTPPLLVLVTPPLLPVLKTTPLILSKLLAEAEQAAGKDQAINHQVVGAVGIGGGFLDVGRGRIAGTREVGDIVGGADVPACWNVEVLVIAGQIQSRRSAGGAGIDPLVVRQDARSAGRELGGESGGIRAGVEPQFPHGRQHAGQQADGIPRDIAAREVSERGAKGVEVQGRGVAGGAGDGEAVNAWRDRAACWRRYRSIEWTSWRWRTAKPRRAFRRRRSWRCR